MRKTYSGKYKVKYPEKYNGDHTKVTYRSYWEKQTFKWIENKVGLSGGIQKRLLYPTSVLRIRDHIDTLLI